MTILAIDPGRMKCGITIVQPCVAPSSETGESYTVLWRGIIQTSEITSRLAALLAEYNITHVLLGDATTSQQIQQLFASEWPQLPITIIDETGSTLEARRLFWRDNPPTGWRRLLPLSLQVPDVSLDDFAAEVLAQRFFQMNDETPG